VRLTQKKKKIDSSGEHISQRNVVSRGGRNAVSIMWFHEEGAHKNNRMWFHEGAAKKISQDNGGHRWSAALRGCAVGHLVPPGRDHGGESLPGPPWPCAMWVRCMSRPICCSYNYMSLPAEEGGDTDLSLSLSGGRGGREHLSEIVDRIEEGCVAQVHRECPRLLINRHHRDPVCQSQNTRATPSSASTVNARGCSSGNTVATSVSRSPGTTACMPFAQPATP
jgi:hypothetical protein